uniref:Uncharacterized protein n=1 Tax=Picea glauca TaxID=3330 RepID=A0A101LWF0_PICGL|nr:hypothetical protein ABT39_MTgene1706 [Picea glauca]
MAAILYNLFLDLFFEPHLFVFDGIVFLTMTVCRTWPKRFTYILKVEDSIPVPILLEPIVDIELLFELG